MENPHVGTHQSFACGKLFPNTDDLNVPRHRHEVFPLRLKLLCGISHILQQLIPHFGILDNTGGCRDIPKRLLAAAHMRGAQKDDTHSFGVHVTKLRVPTHITSRGKYEGVFDDQATKTVADENYRP